VTAEDVRRVQVLTEAFLNTFSTLSVPIDVALSALASTMATIAAEAVRDDAESVKSELHRFADRLKTLLDATPSTVDAVAAMLGDEPVGIAQ
jgi:cytochrome c556